MKQFLFVKFGHRNAIAWKKQVMAWNYGFIQLWLEIYPKFISQLSVLKNKNEKDLDQVKTKTRSLDKEFKDIKACWIELLRRTCVKDQGKNGRNLYSWSASLCERQDRFFKMIFYHTVFKVAMPMSHLGYLLMAPNVTIHSCKRETQSKLTTQTRKKSWIVW